MATIALMSTSKTVPLQIAVPKEVRSRMKSVAARPEIDLNMGELGTVVLDYTLSLIESGKIPAALAKLIEEAKKQKGNSGE